MKRIFALLLALCLAAALTVCAAAAPDVPATGDDSSYMIWAIVAVISAAAIAMIVIDLVQRGKKKKK